MIWVQFVISVLSGWALTQWLGDELVTGQSFLLGALVSGVFAAWLYGRLIVRLASRWPASRLLQALTAGHEGLGR